MNLFPIRKQSVLKAVRDNGKWTGWIAPDKANCYHITGGWRLGMELTIRWDEHSKIYYAFFGEGTQGPFQTRKLDDVLNEFEVYNCNSELGKRIRFWGEN